ncbi:MAG: YbaL family putative K(+) efflux transporter [Rhodospirillaceae bacterium]
MPHETPLIATIVVGLVLAFIFGAIANRFRISPLVGYLLAGIAVGPQTPGFVADASLAHELAEIGVILLMFGVGLHFSLKELLSVRAIAIPGAVVQIAIATLLGMGLAAAMGWSLGAGVVFGLALSVASTVVLLRALQERHLISTPQGHIAVGWLIVEDLAMVMTLVLLPPFAGLLGGAADTGAGAVSAGDIFLAIGVTLLKVGAFVAVMVIGGRRIIPWILHHIAHTGSRELFRLSVLAIALGTAYGAAVLFGVSFALGAFFAGMMMSESELSQQAANETLPLRDAFAVLFFVAVGMLFNPMILVEQALPLTATVLIIIVGKSAAALGIVLLFKRPLDTALMISASLAQIGEFSFILATLGVDLGLLPTEGRDLILGGAIISILLNPFIFGLINRFGPRLRTAFPAALTPEAVPAPPPAAPQAHAVVVGYGRVGSVIGEALRERARPFVVIEEKREIVTALEDEGITVVTGPRPPAELMTSARVADATAVFVAVPNCFEAGQFVEQARKANPDVLIVARAHLDAEVDYLQRLGANVTIMGEREIGRAMVEQATVHRKRNERSH